MSGSSASNAALPRLLVVEGGTTHDVFEVLAAGDGKLTARSAYLFELGEELDVRIERGGAASEGVVRVIAHVRRGDELVTELELAETAEVRRVVSG